MVKLQENVLLKNFSNFKIGGKAQYFLEVFSKNDLIDALKLWQEMSKDFSESKKRIFVLGGGTNVIFSDDGFDGLIIKNSIGGISKEEDIVTVGPGISVASLLEFCIENSLSGLEWAGGLPGTVGGAVRGNAGAFKGEIKDSVIEVESVDIESLEEKVRINTECEFDYRNSVFKKNNDKEVITNVKFKLLPSDKHEIQKLIQEKIDARNLKHPLEYPNAGSIFKNIPIEKFTSEQMKNLSQYIKNDPFPLIPTAKINFLAGLLGKRVGDAQLSEKHTNYIINLGNATAADVYELINLIKQAVKEKFNITLEEEVMFVD